MTHATLTENFLRCDILSHLQMMGRAEYEGVLFIAYRKEQGITAEVLAHGVYEDMNSREQSEGYVNMVPKAGLEPARASSLPPQDSVSTNSTTPAIRKNSIKVCLRVLIIIRQCWYITLIRSRFRCF